MQLSLTSVIIAYVLAFLYDYGDVQRGYKPSRYMYLFVARLVLWTSDFVVFLFVIALTFEHIILMAS